jgi:hypothetical protein
MKKENSISQELISIGSRLADYSHSMPYRVPDGFFTDFSVNLHDTIQELNIPDAAPVWSKRLPYSVPEGYFDALSNNIYAAIENDIMRALPKGALQHVPVGYFDALPAQLLAAAKESDAVKKQVKLIPLRRRNANPIRWAAAAVFLMCIGLGSYETFYNRQLPNPENMLASVTNNDIQDYLQGTYRIDIDHITANNDISNLQVDNTDIVEYLNETGWDQTE